LYECVQSLPVNMVSPFLFQQFLCEICPRLPIDELLLLTRYNRCLGEDRHNSG
jgi:hypothetical protein